MRRFLLTVAAMTVALTVLTPAPARARDSIGWKVACGFSHRLQEDPIVYPRQRNAGHLHDYYGNRSADRNSTLRSLRRGRTNCGATSDKAGYWAPTLFYRGEPVKASNVDFYYRSNITKADTVKPYPAGLKIIAGDAHARRPQKHSVQYWGCDHGHPSSDMPFDCGSNNAVTAHINFPECWDGRRRDSNDHQSHMRYARENSSGEYNCTRRYPVPVPRLIIRLEWPISNGDRVTLSSGEPFTMHADFFNAWKQKRLKRLVKRCINVERDCGRLGS